MSDFIFDENDMRNKLLPYLSAGSFYLGVPMNFFIFFASIMMINILFYFMNVFFAVFIHLFFVFIFYVVRKKYMFNSFWIEYDFFSFISLHKNLPVKDEYHFPSYV